MLEPPPQNASAIAVFDFDHTLITGDSFFPFLDFVSGRSETWPALLKSLVRYFIVYQKNSIKPELRTFIKAELIRQLLTGKSLEEIRPAVLKVAAWKKWNEPIRQALIQHHAKGHLIAIASGGLDLYLPSLLEDLPYHALICTEIAVKDAVILGTMASRNCVREHKAEMVALYLKQFPPFMESWGYGNHPHDLPMMALFQHRIVV